MFGRFREKVIRAHTNSYAAAHMSVLQREHLKTLNGFKTQLSEAPGDAQYFVPVQVHEAAPGRFNPTTSDRIDKMYKEVSRSHCTAAANLLVFLCGHCCGVPCLQSNLMSYLLKLLDDHAGARSAGT